MKQQVLLSVIAMAGALLFSGYGNAESQPQKQISSNTNQVISFKDIPLGKPGVIDTLKKMCAVKKFNTMHDRCSFTDESIMVLLDYETLVDAFAVIVLDNNGALIRVEIDGSTQEMLTLAKALEKKYGEPLKKKGKVKKAIGILLDTGSFELKETEESQLDREAFVWVDDQGSRVIVQSIYSDYDKGGVVIESSLAAARDAAGKKAK
ncbi:MAG TPA: hypothetical protein VMW07_10325 [Gallionella sp.]|jgi:hypothetical protein|nr:hypothetical protein [Gallionella sp.]